MATEKIWPKISIITPSFNQGPYIERTIRSVLDQDYPNIEYIIVDGGSTDGTLDVVRRYQDRLAYWVSEPDDGQTHAINKGLRRSTGNIFAYINSDDYYYPGAFLAAAKALTEGNAAEPQRQWVGGIGDHVDSAGKRVYLWKPSPRWYSDRAVATLSGAIAQHACFWRRSLLQKVGYFDERFHYCMDTEFQVRLVLAGFLPVLIDNVIGAQFFHEDAKTAQGRAPFDHERALMEQIACEKLTTSELRRIRFIPEMRRIVSRWQEGKRLGAVHAALRTSAKYPRHVAWALTAKLRDDWPWASFERIEEN